MLLAEFDCVRSFLCMEEAGEDCRCAMAGTQVLRDAYLVPTRGMIWWCMRLRDERRSGITGYGYRALEWRGKYAVTAPGNETWKILLRAIRLETSGFNFCVLTQEENVGLDPRALKEPTVRSGVEVSKRVLSGIQKVYEEHTKRRIK